MKDVRFEKYGLSQITADDLEDGKIFELNTGEKIMCIQEESFGCGDNHPLGPCCFRDTDQGEAEGGMCYNCMNSNDKMFFFIDV